MTVGDRLRILINVLTAVFAIVAVVLLLSAVVDRRPFGASLDVYVKLLSFLGLVLTAAFAIVGRVVEFRTEDKSKISPWGWTVLLGSAVSFVVSASSFFLGIYKDNEAVLNTAKRNGETLTVIRRAANRIHGFSLFLPLQYSAVFPPELRQVADREGGKPGIEIGGPVQYVTACAENFPHFGVPGLDRKFSALGKINVEVAIVEHAAVDRLIASITSSSPVPLTAKIVAERISRHLEHSRLSGSNNITAASLKAGCAEDRNGATITFSMGSDDFILVKTPLADITSWRSDGTITSSDDLRGKSGIIWTSLFSGRIFPDERLPSLDYMSVAYPPAGISCFSHDSGNGAMRLVPVRDNDMLAVVDFDKASKRKSIFC